MSDPDPIADRGALPPTYSAGERVLLLALARQTVTEVVRHHILPAADVEKFPASFFERKACFVTLTKAGHLRGCIGHITPQEALYLAVMDNAHSAAARDSRFPSVKADEVEAIAIEISVLTEPQWLAFDSPDDLLNKLHPHRDGVVLHIGDHRATYLPQVWEQLPDKTAFLDSLARKAGCGPFDWHRSDTRVQIYQVESFHEAE